MFKLIEHDIVDTNNFKSRFVNLPTPDYGTVYINNLNRNPFVTTHKITSPRATVGGHNFFMLLQVMATPTNVCLFFLRAGQS